LLSLCVPFTTTIVANAIVREAFAHARSLSLEPLSVCVLDAGGVLVAYGRCEMYLDCEP
jgi:uncharacterized protein GlcG (DUF336 family)